jgi:hypothetical protein
MTITSYQHQQKKRREKRDDAIVGEGKKEKAKNS